MRRLLGVGRRPVGGLHAPGALGAVALLLAPPPRLRTSDRVQLRAAEQLASELEAHRDDEEQQLVGALNALTGAAPWDPPRTGRLILRPTIKRLRKGRIRR